MLKCTSVAVFMLSYVIFVHGEDMIGPGKWKIYQISYEEGEVNDIIIDLKQSMINRTHYVYNGEIIAHKALDRGMGMKMDVCQHVDGGCKQFQMLTDNSFVDFVNKYAGENVKSCFTAMGVEPPELPLQEGKYEVEDFYFDVLQLPTESAYGRFSAHVCAMSGNMPCGCIVCECEFYRTNEDDDEDDE